MLVNKSNKNFLVMGLILGSGNTKPQYPYDMWYGVQGDFSSLDASLTRVGNLDLHRTLPIQSKLRRFVENTDGSVKYYLHQNDSRKKDSGAAAIIDSTDGNVMLEIPEYYVRVEIQGTKWIYAISEYPLPGFVKMERKAISPWYGTIDAQTNTAISGSFILWSGNEVARDTNGYLKLTTNAARYRGGGGSSDSSKDGTYNSMLGMPRTSVAKSTVRAYCKNGTHIGAYRPYNQIAWLQRIEYASLNCQATYNATLTSDGFHQGGLGSGCSVDGGQWNTWGGCKPFVPSGITATLGNNTGKVNYTVKGWTGGDKVITVTSYRGLEAPFEYLWMLADDFLVWNREGSVVGYLCEDPTKFTSHSDPATTVPDGYVAMSELPTAGSYIRTNSFSNKGYSFPDSIGGSGTTGYCDQYWTAYGDGGRGWYGALLAALAYSGAAAGFGSLDAGYRSSYSGADSGFRLCRF